MILMATFSPVRMCRPSLTLAKPPVKHTSLIILIRDDKTPKAGVNQLKLRLLWLPEPMVS